MASASEGAGCHGLARSTSLRAMRVIIQNRNSTVKALLSPDRALMSTATLVTSPNENSENRRPSSRNSGRAGRVRHQQLVGAGNELAAVPERSRGLQGEQIRGEGDGKKPPSQRGYSGF